MKNIIISIIMISAILSLGKMPNDWNKPQLATNPEKTKKISNISILGTWNINIEKIVEIYKKSDDYLKVDEQYKEVGLSMITNIFSNMTFEFKENGLYVISGVPTPTGEMGSFESSWSENEGKIILKSPNKNDNDDMILDFKNMNSLVPVSKNAEMFYLVR
jgi:hypothetical protein